MKKEKKPRYSCPDHTIWDVCKKCMNTKRGKFLLSIKPKQS